MTIYENNEIWFVTGAQLLYGGETVKIVDSHSQAIVNGLNESGRLPMNVVYKGTANSATEVSEVFAKANVDPRCVGVIAWMHTFSPAKMWIHGLKSFQKPLLHLHTQFNREIPWADIDMDYMNLNQSAHGDREFGHIVSRLRINRKVVVGFWQEESTAMQIASWMRVCAAWADQQNLKVVRFGDNMNNVAVTDGDKVEAETVLGYHVDYYPIGDLAAVQADVTDAQIADMIAQYEDQYELAPNAQKDGADRNQVIKAAREELAIRQFLADKGAFAFTTNFDALHGLDQLPGLASQRLMADGGSIVFISSCHAAKSVPGRALYTISKAAIGGMTRSLAVELGCLGIRVNAILAGAIRTDRWDGLSDDEIAARRARWPAGRESTPEQIAAAVAFLCSDAACTITGAELPVDSGIGVCLLAYNKDWMKNDSYNVKYWEKRQ